MGYRASSGISYRSLQVPFQHALPLLAVHSREQGALIDLEVNQMLEKAAIHIVHPHEKEQGFISALFLVPKKGGGQRPVINLRPLNQYIPYEHFKMEGIHMPRYLLRKDDYMVKIDLKDAYFTRPVWKNHQKFLRFIWKETGVHKVNETCGCPIKETGYSSYYIPGRHTYYGRDRNPSQSTCTDNLQSSGGSRVCDKLSEIHPHPIQKDGISGIFSRFPSTDPCSSSRQNSKSKERVSESPGFAGCHSARTGQDSRSPHFNYPG